MRRKVTVLSGVVIRQRPRIDQDRLIPNPRSVLPTALDRVRRKLAGANDGDRQMVKILAAVLSDGLPAVEAACHQALAEDAEAPITASLTVPMPPARSRGETPVASRPSARRRPTRVAGRDAPALRRKRCHPAAGPAWSVPLPGAGDHPLRASPPRSQTCRARCTTSGIVRLNSILRSGAPGRGGGPLFLLINRQRVRRDSTPKIAYTVLP